ncbi:MAG: glycoside hydrolase family 2 protein [Oryzihumus sp.]
MPGLLTRWGRELDADHPLPEYPRPQLERDSYLNLNGRWSYAVTALGAPQPERWDGEIVVPFSPEAPLSGVGRQVLPDELLWYRRDLVLPDGFAVAGGRVLLHFGAVDQTCTVWLNGVEVGGHHGGYLPFALDVTDALRPAVNDLVVRVRDLSNNRGPSSGKQRLERGGIWYTAQSGIWQTVWAESVPAEYVERLVLTPRFEEGVLRVEVVSTGSTGDTGSTGEARVRVLADGAEVASGTTAPHRPLDLHLSDVRPWSPEEPFRYEVRVTLGDDRVRSHVGMRSFGVRRDEYGRQRLLLNGEPYLHVGVLDQGYWPDGLMTPPSDVALVHDITTMKRLGFTMLRKHIKVEPLRWYDHCDRLGMLVWQDFVNGGAGYRTAAVTWPGRGLGRRLLRLGDGPRWYGVLGRRDPAGRAEFREEVRRTVELLRNVTSLACWVPFNEGWGQFDAADVAAEVAGLDPTRAVDHASGWHDQGAGDLRSVHAYGRRFRMPRRDSRVLALTEYGGYDLVVDGHTWSAADFGYRHFDTADELAAAFTRLHRDDLAPAVRRGLGAVVYTQVSDVEDELNGLMTYDREVLKLPEAVVRAALAHLHRAASSPAESALVPTETRSSRRFGPG